MPINWQEVNKAIKEYKRERTFAIRQGFTKIIDFFEWVKWKKRKKV